LKNYVYQYRVKKSLLEYVNYILSKIFSFWGPIPSLLHWWGEICHAKFYPISATCRPCGAKSQNCWL